MDRFTGITSCADLVDPLRRSLIPSFLHSWPAFVGFPPPMLNASQGSVADVLLRPCWYFYCVSNAFFTVLLSTVIL
ncbi:unnamed protein product [Onchocerca flexuosa]|uniref:Uncharacterized protein n=1 Tax=Onchocerca flexuosa TaxID=387005 RepID=A0A183I646_9BILA|nr:unnamed protein product [Onchocerca flexuosa]